MFAEALRKIAAGKTRGPLDNFWYGPARQGAAVAGVEVDDIAALNVSTFYACLRVLSDTIGSLPWMIYRSTDDEQREQDKDHPWYTTLHDRPNQWQTAVEWRSMAVGHLILRGNFYARRDPPDGFWRQSPSLVPLNPDRMEVEQLESTRLRYSYRYQTGGTAEYTQDEILHIKMLAVDGIYGIAPLAYARETLGLSLAQQRHSQSLFSGGGFIKYFLKTTKRLGKDGRENFRKSWRDLHGDPSNFQPPILEDDMDLKTLGMTNKDAEWLEGRKHGAYEVCQFLGVPPHLVFLLDRATFSNIEHQGIEFSTIHVNPWLIRFEQAIQPFLDSDHFSEFNRDALVRGDIESRYKAYSIALGGRAFLKTNEVRKRENMPPEDGGDVLMEPMNMAPAGGGNGNGGNGRDDDGATQEPPEMQAATPDEPSPLPDLRPLVEDVARRIVAREVQGIGARAGKASQDREAFDQWATGWCSKHIAYVEETLRPLAQVAGVDPGSMDTFCGRYCLEVLDEIKAADDVPQLLAQWEAFGAQSLAVAIRDELEIPCTKTF